MATMVSSSIFFSLRNDMLLRPCDGYAMFYSKNGDVRKIVSPSEALILSLCNGKSVLSDIACIFSKTFDVDYFQAVNAIKSVMERNAPYIKKSNQPAELLNGVDPLDFIMFSRMDEIADGKLPLDPPWEVGLVVSYECNFNCRYCFLPGATHVKKGSLTSCSFKTCKKVIAEACSWGVPYIGIFGGEPLMYPKWDELAAQVLDGGSIPLITTNGSLIGENEAKRIAKIGIPRIVVSLEAIGAEMFSRITRAPIDGYSRVLNAIRLLRRNGVRVAVKGVCMPENIRIIEELAVLLAEYGVEEMHFVRMERGHPAGNSWNCPVVSHEDLEYVREITRRLSEKYGIAIKGPRGPANDAFPCGSMHVAMGVRPPGVVGICAKFAGNPDFDLGDVREQSLKEIWYGERMENFRRRCTDPTVVDKECATCSKLQNCRTGCFFDSYMATGNPLAPPSYCSRLSR
jgi:radical SAM protein with 4Fe4S-binding SPASM domain